jgi:hypothetical protein
MASLLAASRQDLAATYGLHARAKSVRFGAAALARLICALWQSNPPLELRVAPGKSFSAKPKRQLTGRFSRLFAKLQVYLPHARTVKKTGSALERRSHLLLSADGLTSLSKSVTSLSFQ